VAIPDAEGKAGMAAITVDTGFSMARLHEVVAQELPAYARPVFIRICTVLEETGTFKPIKARLADEGYTHRTGSDDIYLADPSNSGFRKLDSALYDLISQGALRL
jgi:fatty-acyl-CoA synthase